MAKILNNYKIEVDESEIDIEAGTATCYCIDIKGNTYDCVVDLEKFKDSVLYNGKVLVTIDEDDCEPMTFEQWFYHLRENTPALHEELAAYINKIEKRVSLIDTMAFPDIPAIINNITSSNKKVA